MVFNLLLCLIHKLNFITGVCMEIKQFRVLSKGSAKTKDAEILLIAIRNSNLIMGHYKAPTLLLLILYKRSKTL